MLLPASSARAFVCWFARRKSALGLLVAGGLLAGPARAQRVLPLYPDSIPNSTGYRMREGKVVYSANAQGPTNVSQPTLTVFLPAKPTGSAVIICPGGGYAFENLGPEGTRVAEVLARHGVAAFVLKYRLPADSIMRQKSIGPLQDAQQAIRLVRERAGEWHVDAHKVGLLGFSAGGHLAATAATHFATAYVPNPADTSLRPDFLVLVYPVITFEEAAPKSKTREHLLGAAPTAAQVRFFSAEQQVTPQTPPTWLTHAGDDALVPVTHSLGFYGALLRNQVPAELHLYPKGGHGFVLSQPAEQWMQPLFAWLRANHWLN